MKSATLKKLKEYRRQLRYIEYKLSAMRILCHMLYKITKNERIGKVDLALQYAVEHITIAIDHLSSVILELEEWSREGGGE